MKSRHSNSTVRAFGQRSIPSTLLFRPRPPNQTRSEDGKGCAKSGHPPKNVSFSDYLNRKLHSKSVLPQALQSDMNTHIGGNNLYGGREQRKRTNGVIEESIFKQFNLANARQENEESRDICDKDEVEALCLNNAMQGCRKRRNDFEGVVDETCTVRSHLLILGDDVTHQKETSSHKRPKQLCNQGIVESNQTQHANKRHLIVLGDDPKPKRGTRRQSSFSREEPKPQYNHYENGAGWWDYEREGVDNDEVGCNEVWEGMGSTTLGEIVDWH